MQVEILRLCGLGYYNLHLVLPFAPMRAMPQGSTPRKLEPGRDRRTTDGGFPRSPVKDRAGVLACYLNEAIALKAWVLPGALASPPVDDVPLDAPPDDAPPVDDPSAREQEFQRSEAPDGSVPKWLASEIKPQVQGKAWDDSILRHVALHISHYPTLGWTDDIADYFNHLPLASSEWWGLLPVLGLWSRREPPWFFVTLCLAHHGWIGKSPWLRSQPFPQHCPKVC